MKVYTLNEAMRFFLENHGDNVTCVKGGSEFVAGSYIEAKNFFNK